MARASTKAEAAAQLIRKRISHGDHVVQGIPGQRQLCDELGISRETLRRALKSLEGDGVLIRQPNGRLEAPEGQVGTGKRIIGMVRHSYVSYDRQLWSEGVEAALEYQNCTLRTVTFEHYGDSAISAALNGFDALFFLAAGEIPKWLSTKMAQSRCKVVVLDQDATAADLRSIVIFPPNSEYTLLDHLTQLGHDQIDCLNSQEWDPILQARVDAWHSFISHRNIRGQLHSLIGFRPINSAYLLIKNRIMEGRPLGTAIMCVTGPAAIGAIRALHEAGFKVGRDISVCAVNDEGLGPYLIPSLTSLQSPPRAIYVKRAIDWMLNDIEWTGPLLVQPEDVNLVVGESTGPAPSQNGSLATKTHLTSFNTEEAVRIPEIA